MESYKLLSSDKKDDIKMDIINLIENINFYMIVETLIILIEIYGSTHNDYLPII